MTKDNKTRKHKRRPIARSGGPYESPYPVSGPNLWGRLLGILRGIQLLQKYPGFHPGGNSQLRLKPVKRPKVVILVGPETAQCRGRRTLGRALNPAAYTYHILIEKKWDPEKAKYLILPLNFTVFAHYMFKLQKVTIGYLNFQNVPISLFIQLFLRLLNT